MRGTPLKAVVCAASLLALVLVLSLGGLRADEPVGRWLVTEVPGAWQEAGKAEAASHEGIAWYRCYVQVPENWARRWELTLAIEEVANAYEVYFNGERVAKVGGFPPDYAAAVEEAHRHTLPSELVRRGELNFVAIRIHGEGERGGFLGRPPALTDYNNEIVLEGAWQFRPGDDVAWAQPPEDDGGAPGAVPVFDRVVGATQARAEPSVYQPGAALGPDESLAAKEVADDLALDLMLAEPEIEQPLHLSFDERGRMWVVEYRQFPYPAGLRMVSRDIYWRTVWEPGLPPPPYDTDSPFLGRDCISVHEDTTGDGRYDTHEVFLDGLNITTAVAHGRGGVWVLTPPHLVFYPVEEDGVTIAGPPEVHLEGFNLEDTHAVVNSLTWGPDGWLYATQGSTVSGAVRRAGTDEERVRSIGQNVWRYHPETRRYEIFAEGGGNAFGVEIDAKGRTFSGHNGGDTRGFHYVQGGYSLKGFAKHGPLSNPYTFGYFPAMEHEPTPRFTHTFLIYEADTLPERFHGKLLGLEPMQRRLVLSDIQAHGSTFRTADIERPIRSDDPAFRPVDIKLAPDGSVYVADFYSEYIAHGEAYEGYLNREQGRIYRIRGAEHEPGRVDLSGRTTDELIDLLGHENRWVRRTVQRLLGDRRDEAAIPRLAHMLERETGQLALEALWALNNSGGFEDHLGRGLTHDDPHVRRWTVRLVGDGGRINHEVWPFDALPAAETQAGRGPGFSEQLLRLAADEPDVEVRSQWASTARRLSMDQAMWVIIGLTEHDEDVDDPHLPLLIWWAIEAHLDPAVRNSTLAYLSRPYVDWDRPMFTQHLLTRMMRRLASTGRRSDLVAAATLFEHAQANDEHAALLLEGLEQAYENRTLSGLPQELVDAMAEAGVASLVLRVRQGDGQALDEALGIFADGDADARERIDYARLFGEVDEARSVPVLLEVVEEGGPGELLQAALGSLQTYNQPEIGERIVAIYGDLPAEARSAAQALLAGRTVWARQWLEAIDARKIDPAGVPREIVEAMRVHDDEAVQTLVHQHFIDNRPPPAEDVRAEMQRVSGILAEGDGDPYAGHPIYMASCSACHQMFGQGGRMGPDLTSYQRDDLHALLRSIVDPNAEVRDGYEGVVVTGEDGRTVMGFLADEDEQTLVVRGLDGQDVTLAKDRVASVEPMGRSLMPDNLLGALTDQQIRDLFAFLRSSQPIRP